MSAEISRLPVVLVLENLRSMHNVGSIFRSADATRIERIILCGLTPTPPRTEIDKTALGATRTVVWSYSATIAQTVLEYKARGYTLYALEQTSTATSLFEAPLKLPAVVVLGHEREGVSSEALKLCDYHLHIPMYGESAHSLNVSTAATVMVYQFSHQFCYDSAIAH